MNIVLGSASPRRKELLKRLYPEFIILPADIEETVPDEIGAEFAPVYLAAQKALALSAKHPNDFIITADTVVLLDGVIFGKPSDDADASRMLHALSGREHKVITGCCITCRGFSETFFEESYVTFYPLEDSEIDEYIKTGEPIGKAGAYAIQEKGAKFVRRIEGDYSNIVGLPISRLYREIKHFLQEYNID